MADRPSHTGDETAWEIHAREARHARLRSLADSINDTARTARNSLSLFLVVALYLGLTLVASTDENLLRNGQVVLPQVGVGLSVVQSYILAPPVFLYLHAQLLLLLTVLARKVRTFEIVLKEEFPGETDPNKQMEECWDWLSAFAFVQLFRLPSGAPHAAKVLAWIGVEAVPLVLLFVLDLSFVRYQSYWITLEHHIVFVFDLGFLIWFNRQVFVRGFPVLWTYLILIRFSQVLREMVVKILRRPGASAHERLPRAERPYWNEAWEVVVVVMALLLIFAHPPSFDPKTVEEDRISIWGNNAAYFLELVFSGHNPLDAGPCKWWTLGCRYLDVNQKRLVEIQAQDISNPQSDESDYESFTTINLAGRNLRFAQFWSVHLRGADLGGARLQGANLRWARLQGANLRGARLQGANLGGARLQGADLGGARLQGANLRGARLPGANLGGAWLPGANLKFADLPGANLREAQLQGANLQEAELQCAVLRNAQLQGADLGNAQLQGSSSKPDSWYLVWAPSVSYSFPADKPSYLKTLFFYWGEFVDLAWERRMPLKEYLQKCAEEDRKSIYRLPDNYSRPDWNSWSEWTAEFACENAYTTHSSLERWMSSEEPLYGLEGSNKVEAEKSIREALAEARVTKTEEECPGLHSISDDEWQEFVEGRRP